MDAPETRIVAASRANGQPTFPFESGEKTVWGDRFLRAPRPFVRARRRTTLTPRRAPDVDELHDRHRDGAEQNDVDETLLAEDEFPHEPPREERGGD